MYVFEISNTEIILDERHACYRITVDVSNRKNFSVELQDANGFFAPIAWDDIPAETQWAIPRCADGTIHKYAE